MFRNSRLPNLMFAAWLVLQAMPSANAQSKNELPSFDLSAPIVARPRHSGSIIPKPTAPATSDVTNPLRRKRNSIPSAVAKPDAGLTIIGDDEGSSANIEQIEELLPLPRASESPLPSPANLSGQAADILGAEKIAPGQPRMERLPPLMPNPVGGDFPSLPPDPYAKDEEPLPPLEAELWHHGGAHLYEPEGDQRNRHGDLHGHGNKKLRLPETHQRPRPLTVFQEFLGADPVADRPRLRWPIGGYSWEPRFVGYGSYEVFAFAMEENNQRRDAIGHQLIAELDLRLTGTERFHVQFRPLGEQNTGGSYYQFSNPDGYVDNSHAEPDRYWFEAELHSLLGAFVDPFAVLDYHVTAGRIPFALHNSLLINDEFHAVVLNKNTIYLGPLSNLNVQLFYAFDDVSAYSNSDGRMYGVHASADYHMDFWEATYAFVQHEFDSTRDAHYAAFSRTKFFGPLTLSARGLLKYGDQGGNGNGQLIVLESNYTRVFHGNPLGIEKAVFFCNGFLSSDGWNSIAGGNFNRLHTAFEVNPLLQIATGQTSGDNWGGSIGTQLFRRHEDESFIPEFAFQSPNDEPVFGFGLRYLRKTGQRSYLEVLGILNLSNDPQFDREGVFISETIAF